LDNPGAQTLLVRRCSYQAKAANAWEADLLPPSAEIDPLFRADILGARRKVLFIEGDERSLDKALYNLIFPGFSVVPKGSCRDVEQAVAGLQAAESLHWVEPFGIIDRDNRDVAEVAALGAKGVYALDVYSVESIYYAPVVQTAVAKRYSTVTGADWPSAIDQAKAAALKALDGHEERLCLRLVEKRVRNTIFANLPNRDTIASGGIVNVAIDIASLLTEERNRLSAAISSGNWREIVGRYPVRETGALVVIAKALGFQNRRDYESAVRKALIDERSLRREVSKLFFGLPVTLVGAAEE
jgi:hypothetical protein